MPASDDSSTAVSIRLLHDLSSDRLDALIDESERNGFLFPRRLIEEWDSGANRFDRPGEALYAAFADGRIIGVCGLNADPYVSETDVGRVRHLYVMAEFRRRDIGRRLVAEVIAAARGRFRRLRLRTQSEMAASFYEANGFRPRTDDPTCTHLMELTD